MTRHGTHSPGAGEDAAARSPVGGGRRLRVATDLSILRHGPSGSARWATGLVRALAERDDIEVRGWLGPRRHRFRGPVRKVLNAAQDRFFYELLLPDAARRWAADVLLMPVNLTARRTRVPQVVTILDANFLVVPEAYDPWYRRYASRMFARAVRDADEITVISAYSLSQLQRWFGLNAERASVVYPGLDPVPEGRLLPPLPQPYALYVGATEPHKNLGVLLDAWGERSNQRLPLVIAGRPGRAHEEIAARALRSNLDVILTGAVDHLTLERWYAGAAVFLFPSLAEGFGYPPLEAMARRIPVVSSSAGSLPEVLGDAALYHNPRDAEALRENVDMVLEDASLREQLIARGLARAARYSWSASAQGMMAAMLRAVEPVDWAGDTHAQDGHVSRGGR